MNDDLISRSALRKKVINKCDVWERWMIDEIDNAPTVDVKPFATVTFDKDELEQIIRDRVIEPIKKGELVVRTEERPHGEWITRNKLNWYGQDVICFECNKCGEYKVPLYHLLITEPSNTCPNCGADMRGE